MWFVDDEEYTRYGYYTINGKKTFSKFEAWENSNGKFEDIQYSYNEDVFDKVDWTVEPTTDIYELYKQRAEEIRNKYDYVVMMFSGGIDSSVALQAFTDNGIKVDEIVVCTTASTQPKDSLFNMEVYNRGIPVGEKIAKEHNIKFTVFDIVDLMNTQYYDKFHLHNLKYYANNATSGNNWNIAIRSYKLKERMTEHMQLAREGKKICYVWGIDKPVVLLDENNNYITKFVDIGIDAAKMYCNRVLLGDYFGNFYDEPFYISRTLPELSAKQVHLLVNKMNSIDPSDPVLIGQDDLGNTGPIAVHHRFKYFRFLPRNIFNNAIYPKEDITVYKDDKVKGSVIFTKRDAWWLDSDHPTKHMWKTYFDKYATENKDFYIFKDDLLIQPKVVFGKSYIIGKAPTE